MLARLDGIGAVAVEDPIQKELLNEMSRQIIAGTLESGRPQVTDVLDGRIVLRKPVDAKEAEKKNGNGKARKQKAGV